MPTLVQQLLPLLVINQTRLHCCNNFLLRVVARHRQEHLGLLKLRVPKMVAQILRGLREAMMRQAVVTRMEVTRSKRLGYRLNVHREASSFGCSVSFISCIYDPPLDEIHGNENACNIIKTLS